MSGYSNGAELARKRQVVFVGHDNVPRYADFLQAGGVPDREDQTWTQKRTQGRNFAQSSVVTGRQGLISGNFDPYYELMTEICYNICGRPFVNQKVLNNAYEADDDGPRRMRQFRFPVSDAPTIFLWDVYVGSAAAATHYGRVKIRQFSMDVARNGDAGNVSGTLEMHANDIEDGLVPMPFSTVANQVSNLVVSGATGGTFTITYTDPVSGDSATTANIAYNASAATVLAALEALSNIDAGQFATSGGALGTAPVVITADGDRADQALEGFAVNGAALQGGNAAVTATVTQRGSDGTGPVRTAQTPIEVDHVLVYLATDKDDLDSIDMTDPNDSHILVDLLGHNFSLGDLWNPVFTENRSKFASNFVAGAMNGELSLTLPEGAQSATINNTALNGCVADRFFLRIAFRCGYAGSEFWIDAKVMRSAAYDPNDSNDIYQKSYPLMLADDADANTLVFTTIDPIA